MQQEPNALRAEPAWRKWRTAAGRRTEFLGWLLYTYLTHGRPQRVVHFGGGPGDDLLCTAVLHELRRRSAAKTWMAAAQPEIFQGNPDPDLVVHDNYRWKKFSEISGARWHTLEYAPYDPSTDRSIPPKQHLIAELCARAGLQGQVALRPYYFVSAKESQDAEWATGMIAIQSSGLGGKWRMENKQWPPHRYQEVVDSLAGKFQFVQLGAASDPSLNGVVSRQGETTLRQTAAILSRCRLFVGSVGFLMHLARAVECPSVIVYGGREAPWQSGYICNKNLYSPESCAPCWLWSRCDFGRVCMERIGSREVVHAIEEMTAMPRGPLVCDLATIEPQTGP